MNNKDYLQSRYNRKRNTCHWRLAMNKIIQYPILLVIFLPIIAFAVVVWVKMKFILNVFEVPKFFLPMYTVIIKCLVIVIPLLLIWGIVDIIGDLVARKDEANIQMAFGEKELRNGSPILMYKRKEKNRNITVREWYSPIPMKLWNERQEEIADAMNLHFIEPFKYGGKSNGNRIVMHSAEGREFGTKNKLLYDEALEKDLEMFE